MDVKLISLMKVVAAQKKPAKKAKKSSPKQKPKGQNE
jgi:hypothetical protein